MQKLFQEGLIDTNVESKTKTLWKKYKRTSPNLEIGKDFLYKIEKTLTIRQKNC